jgi:hypothetical protein
MALDLVQVRWQLIRATEANQFIERENVQLRQEVIKLKGDLEKALNAEPDAPPITRGVDLGHTQKLTSLLLDHSMKNKSELMKMRLMVTKESEELCKQFDLVHKLQNLCSHLLTDQDQQSIYLKKERKNLVKQLASCQSELQVARQGFSRELAVKDENIAQLKSEIRLHLNTHERMKDEMNQMEARCAEMLRARLEAEKSLQVRNYSDCAI